MGFKIRNHLWLILITSCALGGCVKGSEVTEVPADALIVDVRTPREFESWNYHGSVNIPVDEIESRADEFGDKNQKIIVYCRSGHRSSAAKEKLVELGFTDVLDGGPVSHMRTLVP